MATAIMDSPHLTKSARRKPSMRQKLREMVKDSSTLRGFLSHSRSNSNVMRTISGSPPPQSQTVDIHPGYDYLSNGLPTKRPEPTKRKARKRQDRSRDVDEKKENRNSLYSLQFENPSLDDLRMSFEKGDDRWSVANPLMIQRELEKELAIGREQAEKEVVQVDHMPGHIKTHLGSDDTLTPSRVDSTRPEHDRVPELRKQPRKYDVKMDTLVRPVSRATANPVAAQVSKTIESINRKEYSVPLRAETGHSRAPSQQTITNGHGNGALERFPELNADAPTPTSIATPSNHQFGANGGKANGNQVANQQQKLPSVSSIQTFPTQMASPTSSSMNNSSAFSFNINENLRRIGREPTRVKQTSDRHSVGDMNKLLEQNREVTAEKKASQPPALTIRRSFSMGSEATKVETAPNTPTYRPRRPSGRTTAERLAWIRELEEGGNGKDKNPGRATMFKNLQGGVANKLAQFEHSNQKLTGGSGLVRTNSVSSRMSASSEAYGIEVGGSRLSRASTLDEEFRRKMEEVAEKAKKKVDKNVSQDILDFVAMRDEDHEAALNDIVKSGDQESVVKQINDAASRALAEERSRKPTTVFKYAFDESAGRKATLLPDTTRTPEFRVKDPRAVAASANPSIDLGSFTANGATKMPQFKVKDLNALAVSANPPIYLAKSKPAEKFTAPQFRVKDLNAVAASANPPIKLGNGQPEEKITAPVFRVKDPNAVAASANPPIFLDASSKYDDDEYDPFNPTKYPVETLIPAIKRMSSTVAKMETTPAKVEIPPTKAEIPPTKAEIPPTKAETTPVKVEATPVKVETPPAKVETTPEQNEAPAKKETSATSPVPTPAAVSKDLYTTTLPSPKPVAAVSPASKVPTSTSTSGTPKKLAARTPTAIPQTSIPVSSRMPDLASVPAAFPRALSGPATKSSRMPDLSSVSGPKSLAPIALPRKNPETPRKPITSLSSPTPTSTPSPAVTPAQKSETSSTQNTSPSSLLLGGRSVSTRSGGSSPTTPTFPVEARHSATESFTAAKLPSFVGA